MGNQASTTPPEHPKVEVDTDYAWPENLYIETRDMGALAFLVYTWNYVLVVLESEDDFPKQDNWTPTEVQKIVLDNKKKLQDSKHGKNFKDGSELYNSLQLLVDREKASNLERPLTIEHWDYEYQRKELAFAIAKDDINKRITLVFRGTESSLAFRSNWGANATITKTSEKLPPALEGQLGKIKDVSLHTGFYKYMNNKTVSTEDKPETTKKDQILKSVRDLVAKNPGYKVFVTGHSLGAALSTIAAYYLSVEDDIPKPVRMVNFASPRVGNSNFLKAIEHLERYNKLRHLRVVNNNDTITVIPSIGFKHVGMMVNLYKKKKHQPEMTYASPSESWGKWFGRATDMSVFASLNFGYDHGEYRQRVETHKEKLEEYNLSELYKNKDLAGFD